MKKLVVVFIMLMFTGIQPVQKAILPAPVELVDMIPVDYAKIRPMQEVKEPVLKPVQIESVQPKMKDLGVFTVTAYTAGPESTGKRLGDVGYGITASGKVVEEGVTVAADWDVLPAGSRVLIEGVGERIVQDRGSAIEGQKLDVFIPSLKDALEFGRKELKVYLIGGD